MTLFKNHSIFAIVAVLLIALVTGYSVGRIYVSTIVPELINPYSVEELVEDKEVVEDLVVQSAGKTPDRFSAVQVFLIAEHKLNNAEKFFKTSTGTVNNSMTGTQVMKSQKIKVGNEFCFNKLSPNLSLSLANVCSQVRYDTSTGLIKVAENGTWIDISDDNLQASFNNFDTWAVEEYQETFNISPSVVLPYIISSNVCFEENMSSVTKNNDGTYSFEINLSGDYLALAASYYSYEIKFFSGLTDDPIWKTLKMSVTVDADFNFVSIDYEEVYDMFYLGVSVTVTDKFYETFEFNDVPAISEIRGSEVA